MSSEYKITETLQKYYDKVFQDGRLTLIHIGMWGMSYNLVEEDIKLDNKLPDTIKLGKKMLIKPAVYNKFKTFEQKARKYLYSNSFDFPLVNQAHFVPKAKYIEVFTKLNEMKAEYAAMVDEFLNKYEDYKQEALDYYLEHKETVSIENLAAYYPPLTKLREKFHFDIVSFEIALPAEFRETDLQTEIQREQLGAEAKQKAGAESDRILASAREQITHEKNAAVAELKNQVAVLSIEIAEKILKSELSNDEKQKALVSNLMKDVNLN